MEFKPKKEYVCKLLSDEGVKFVIPEYQRPYRWGIDECETFGMIFWKSLAMGKI